MARTPNKNNNRAQSSQAESPSSFSTARPNCELLPIHVNAVALHASALLSSSGFDHMATGKTFIKGPTYDVQLRYSSLLGICRRVG